MTDAERNEPSGSSASASDPSGATTTAPTRPSSTRARSTNRSRSSLIPPRLKAARSPDPLGGRATGRYARATVPMVEFHDVHKWFGPLHVLDGIELTVDEGQVVVII